MIPELTASECRVLGVLIEKAQTTPSAYPLSLNALVTGSNQRSNRHPELNLDESAALEAVDGLRVKGLLREVMLSGSRVAKFRHIAREGLQASTSELVVLAELLLRGPQTVGELRGRASRMHALESIDTVQSILAGLMTRDEPLVREIAPAPGSRAKRYAQLLCPDLHPLDEAGRGGSRSAHETAGGADGPTSTASATNPVLAERIERLELELQQLHGMITIIAQSLKEAGVSVDEPGESTS